MSTQNLNLSGKIALVTGGSRGIGSGIAKLLAARGASVAVTYSKSADAADAVVKEIEAAGGKALAVQGDASDPKSAAAAVEQVVKAAGGLDILVNNAAIAEVGPIDADGSEGDDGFTKMIALNVAGVWATTRAAVPHLKEGARIINIGSTSGQQAVFGGMSAYSATKHAVHGLTKSWARDLAGRGITVNTVAPGPIDTEMNPADGEIAAQVKPLVPLGRYGTTEEVAELTAFVASPAASFITGAELRVDGGMLS